MRRTGTRWRRELRWRDLGWGRRAVAVGASVLWAAVLVGTVLLPLDDLRTRRDGTRQVVEITSVQRSRGGGTATASVGVERRRVEFDTTPLAREPEVGDQVEVAYRPDDVASTTVVASVASTAYWVQLAVFGVALNAVAGSLAAWTWGLRRRPRSRRGADG